MRTFRPWRTRNEGYDSQRAAGRFNPALEMEYFTDKSYTVTLGAGHADGLDVFIEGQRIYVLSTNSGLEYVGLQVFENGEEVAETFIDSAAPNIDYLLELTPIYRAKRMANWIDS